MNLVGLKKGLAYKLHHFQTNKRTGILNISDRRIIRVSFGNYLEYARRHLAYLPINFA
jgi:hypothetical protein